MNIIQENSLLIIGVLLILLLFAGLIIYIQYDKKQKKNKRRGPSSGTVPKEEYEELLEKYNHVSGNYKSLKTKFEQLNKDYCSLRNKYSFVENKCEDVELENGKLKNTIDKLRRDNDELNKLFEKESAHVAEQPFRTVVVPADFAKQQNQEVASKQEQQKQEQVAEEIVLVTTEVSSSETITTKEEPPIVPVKEVIMYASFPRSAGSRIYFSDLTENLVDDSFFELKISNANGKATFKPLDFMKIRNYDPAMAAMLTNGVKPNVASTVLGIEPGKAHIEGKDWIIDNPAKIKLA